jgi:putative membrane protein
VIDYDRTIWWRACFAWRGTVLPYILGRVGLLTLIGVFVYLFEVVARRALGQGQAPLPALDPLGHTVLGVALGMLIVFRTNSSNNRYWEARSHWGMIVNTSRNLVRMAAAYAPPADELARLVSAYVLLVKEQLRDRRDLDQVRHLLPGRVLARLEKVNNPASVLAGVMTEWVLARQAEGQLDPIHANRMEGLIGVLVDQQGACEKIHRTPLPFVYAALIKQVLFLYLATLPFVLVPKMGVIAPLVVAGVSLGMLGIEEAGVEVEDPFGLDPNHLPLDGICTMIARDVADLAAGDTAG